VRRLWPNSSQPFELRRVLAQAPPAAFSPLCARAALMGACLGD
jgi:hypothetical protein